MAGDWIKMRTDLRDDPAVIAVAAGLGIDEDTVVGKLHRLWSWADRHTTNGRARVTPEWIDRFVSAPGFSKVLAENGWLDLRDGETRIPNFGRHNGETGKRRALAARRAALKRSRDSNANVVTKSAPTEEKIREESEKIKKSASDAFAGMTEEILRDDAALAAWHSRVSSATRPVVPASEAGLLFVFSAAERALRKGRNPVALFATLFRKGKSADIASIDEDAARARLATMQSRAPPADLVEALNGFGSIPGDDP